MCGELARVRRVGRLALGPGLAVALAACAPHANAPASDDRAVEQTRSAPAVPSWVRELLPQIQLGSAGQGAPLVDGPNIVVTPERVLIDGHTVAAVAAYTGMGPANDPVFDFMKQLRHEFIAMHPGVPFPGVVTLWVDRRVPPDKASGVLQSAGYAGFVQARFAVRDATASARFVRVGAAVYDPRLASVGKLNVGIPPAVIQGLIRAHYGVFRSCYEQALAKDPEMKGRVVVRFDIEPDGRVAHLRDDGSTLADKRAVACIILAYQKLVFPSPPVKKVTVVYPIIFTPEK